MLPTKYLSGAQKRRLTICNIEKNVLDDIDLYIVFEDFVTKKCIKTVFYKTLKHYIFI
jgi:hypothetical protein